MKLFEKIRSHRKIIASALSLSVTLGILVFAVVTMLPRSLAWLASNRHTGASGMSLSATEDYLRFADSFSARAVMNNVDIASREFVRGKDGNYYFTDPETGESDTLFYDSLFPGEHIEMTLRFTCAPGRVGGGYRLYFSELSESDTFVTRNQEEYSILGVYRLSVLQSDGTWQDKGFLAKYDGTAVADTVDITKGSFDTADAVTDENGVFYWSVTLRLTIDLEQYQNLDGIYSNLLSEKTAAIHSIVLAPGEGA